MEKTRIVIIAGPTGAGKTSTAIAVCNRFDGVVINFDSRQVYRDFPIITAQPTTEEQARCPHLMYGFLPCREKITAGAFIDMAGETIAREAARGRLPVLVGGTGLYMRALLEGLAPIPAIPDEVSRKVRGEHEESGQAAMYERLQTCDPEYAAGIHPNDRQRTLRALEVFEGTSRSLSWWHGRPLPEPRYDALRIGITMEREALKEKLARRIEVMLDMGAEAEARKAWDICPDPMAPGWTGIGCAEMLAYIRGRSSLEETISLWFKATRDYAKRQMTWFRKDHDIRWFGVDEPERVLAAVEEAGRVTGHPGDG